MPNIFDRITGTMPAPRKKDLDALAAIEHEREVIKSRPSASMSLKDLVPLWQKDPSKDNTKLILDKLQPTIKSAINSYAQGMENEMSIPAARLALSTLKTFDPGMGTEPSTYVFHGLKRLNRLATDRTQMIKYPEQMMADGGRIRRMMTDFEDEHGREPSMDELADKLGMSRKKIERILDMPSTVNDSSMVSDDTGDNLMGSKDVTDTDYFDYVYESVGPLDQKIMEWTSGLHGKPALSNNEIAAKLGLSAAAVSQHKAKIQNMLSEVRSLV